MANNSRVKGITVKIGGDVSGLDKALQKVNSEINDTQAKLQDIKRLLKMDPGNTELLRQKQQQLSKAVGDTKDKLEQLKDAENQLKDAGVDENSAQFQNLQREIIETEQNLKKLQIEAENTSAAFAKMEKAGKALSSVGDKVEGVGKKLSVVSAGIAGLGTAAVKTAADFDSAMSQVTAISGAAGDEFDALREKAREMGEKTKFSASEAAEAMTYMAMAGWKTQDMLDGIDGIMHLAAASGEELGSVSDIVTDALTAFGLSAADAGHFADVLAAASNSANTNVSMLGGSFKYVAPVAGALGYSIEDVSVALGLMANSGIKAEQGGTALRSMLSRLAKPTKEVEKAFLQLGISASDALVNADGSMKPLSETMDILREKMSGLSEAEQANVAAGIAGQEAMSGLLAIVNASASDYDNLRAAIAGADGTAEKMAGTMQDNLNGQLTILKSQLEELAISFGDLLMPLIRDVVTAIQGFVDKLNSMDDSSRKVILTVAAIAAAIGPLLVGVGKTMSAIGSIMTGIVKLHGALGILKVSIANGYGIFGKFAEAIKGIGSLAASAGQGIAAFAASAVQGISGAFSTVGSFLAANPIVLIIAAVAAAVAAIAVYGDEIQALLQKLDDWLQGVFARDWTEVFGPVLGGVLNGFFANVKAVWDSIKQTFDGIIDFIRGVFTGDWQRAWEGVKEIFGGVFKGLTALAKAPVNGIIALLNGAINGINKMIDALNSLHFSIPDWVPFLGGKSFGLNLRHVGSIPYLANGGILSRGSAVVGEAGPELLTLTGGKAVVQPLGGSSVVNNRNLGGVSIAVYGAPGQDVDALAEVIMDKIQVAVDRREAVFA